jgi:hypothetical protein
MIFVLDANALVLKQARNFYFLFQIKLMTRIFVTSRKINLMNHSVPRKVNLNNNK